uniref:EF-hand domain-containing protein n=1 Tax=Plectus sambesii TaxID=2011161 RepID=A0A914UZ17_9BILA
MPVDSFLEKKWKHAFQVFFDTNKSESLEKQDFDMLAEKIKQQRGEDSKAYRTAKASVDRIWKAAAAAATETDIVLKFQVSIDEWIAMWSALVLQAKTADDWQNAYIDYMFTLLDASGDDKIDKNEYVQVMKLYGVGTNEAGSAFDKFAQVSQ